MTEFSHLFRIYLEDTDAGGIVYHANHLKYLERVRREWLRQAGIKHYTIEKGYQFVVHSVDLQYKHPLKMDDLICVTVSLEKLSKASMVLKQHIYLENTSGITATVATVKLACVNEQLKPTAIPSNIATLINNS